MLKRGYEKPEPEPPASSGQPAGGLDVRGPAGAGSAGRSPGLLPDGLLDERWVLLLQGFRRFRTPPIGRRHRPHTATPLQLRKDLPRLRRPFGGLSRAGRHRALLTAPRAGRGAPGSGAPSIGRRGARALPARRPASPSSAPSSFLLSLNPITGPREPGAARRPTTRTVSTSCSRSPRLLARTRSPVGRDPSSRKRNSGRTTRCKKSLPDEESKCPSSF